MEEQIAALQAQVAKEKTTSRENLKKVMKANQEKKAAEARLAQLEAAAADTGASERAAASEARVASVESDLAAARANEVQLSEELAVVRHGGSSAPGQQPSSPAASSRILSQG